MIIAQYIKILNFDKSDLSDLTSTFRLESENVHLRMCKMRIHNFSHKYCIVKFYRHI